MLSVVNAVMLGVTFFRYSKCHYAECRAFEWHINDSVLLAFGYKGIGISIN